MTTETIQETKKSPKGSIKSISLTINNMKVDKIELNKLSLFTGANGSGKTVILVSLFAISSLARLYFAMGENKDTTLKFAQYVMDNCFLDQDFTGDIEGQFEGFTFKISLDKGKVIDLEAVKDSGFTLDPKTEVVPVPFYMSSKMRLMTALTDYVKIKKAMGIDSVVDLSNSANIEKISSVYRLYDIIAAETTLSKLSNPFFKLPEEIRKQFTPENGFQKNISHVFFDEKKGDIFFTETKADGTKEDHSISRLSAGEQAMLHMIINQV